MKCKNCQSEIKYLLGFQNRMIYWCPQCGTILDEAHREMNGYLEDREHWHYPKSVENANKLEKEQMFQMDMDSFRIG